ncbi:MAG: hypothetical protein CMJ32_04105 [Phycisphaerae bacterium]|nr:hypothetical protein [Phycisphaerae bacterium]
MFLGEYEHSIDDKHRLAIPAEIRDQLDQAHGGHDLVVAPGANELLWLWPESTFQDLASALGGSLVGDENMLDFERLFFSQAARMSLDSAGRIRLPERLISQYALSGSVMILGVRDHLELCVPGDWRQQQKQLEQSHGQIWSMARKALAQRTDNSQGQD